MDIQKAILEHAAQEYPREACGLIATSGKKARIIPAKNLAEEPEKDFDLDPDAWLKVGDDETVVACYHSHCDRPTAVPSQADLVSCEESGMDWHIVAYPSGDYVVVSPSGYQAPYLQRVYAHGILDCYSIARDWYFREWGLLFPDYERKPNWWNKGYDLYVDHFKECGFIQLIDQEVEVGDAFLMQVMSPVPNHVAICVEPGKILHHPQFRLSRVDAYGGYWAKHTTHHLRHKSRMK